jgi:hypothetical protein
MRTGRVSTIALALLIHVRYKLMEWTHPFITGLI